MTETAPEAQAQPDPARRALLALAGITTTLIGGCAAPVNNGGSRLGFAGVSVDDSRNGLRVPTGYTAQVLAPWGDAVGIAGAMPSWKPDAGDGAAEQALQLGMQHGALQYLSLDGSRRGLLLIQHPGTNDGLLHADGPNPWTADKVKKAQAARGLSVIEVALMRQGWQPVRPSRLARRITAATPCTLQGPAAGHVLMRTAADPAGRRVLGLLGHGGVCLTPWGSCLAGEDHGAGCFDGPDQPTADQQRWGLGRHGAARWAAHDLRFDARRHPNEFHRFGWAVEFDPLDPAATPVKRSALGRRTHAGLQVAVTKDGRAVVYSADGAGQESVYKFVSRDAVAPGGAQANASLLDHGTLYVARFDADGSGRWLPLVHGQGPLVPANGFADPAELLIKSRQAADRVGATKLDRPAGITLDAARRALYCALSDRLVRWQEDGDFDAERFAWTPLRPAAEPASEAAEGRLRGDRFARPETLALDARGLLWIATAIAPAQLYQGDLAELGSNQLLACDPTSGEVRRFLTGPRGSAIGGCGWAPDGRTLFVDVQHPGEPPGGRSDPAEPAKVSSWPELPPGGRPRSATVAIRKADGGVIGT